MGGIPSRLVEQKEINRPRINVMGIKQVKKPPESNTEEDKEKRIQESLIILKDFVDDAGEVQEKFDDQYKEVKYLVDELDRKSKEEFWIYLDHNRAEVKRKKKMQICLDTLKEIKDMVQNQKDAVEDFFTK